jgi:outer membrane protein OmpA-like peptidoglycan-associated protein
MLKRLGLSIPCVCLIWVSLPTLARAQKPAGKWQTPKPADQWQKPGEIQVPRGIQAIKKQADKCQQRFAIGADALFEFDKWTLSAQAEETLRALLPLLAQTGKHPVSIEGHTDSVGADAYNQTLSEKRAQAVKGWLVEHKAVAAPAAVKGFGETKPVAPNTKPNGADDPAGRQRNRRVEIVVDTCR